MPRFSIALALILSSPALAQPATEGPSRAFQGSDLFGLQWASDPQISPDGGQVAYVRRSNDIMTDRARPSIWLIDTRTGAQSPLVAGAGAHMSPRWSPDGKRLAYVSTAEGGAPQLYVRWMATGQTARITDLPDSPGALSWSPDGKRIAYMMRVPGEAPKLGIAPAKPEGADWAKPLEVITAVQYRQDGAGYSKPGFDHVFIVSADGGAPRQLTFGQIDDGGPLSWSPDGKTLYFSANHRKDWEREPMDSEVYALNVDSGALTALTDRRGPDAGPVVSPDGRHIAWLGFDDQRLGYQNVRLSVMDADGRNPHVVTANLDRSVNQAAWSGNSALVVQYDDHGLTKIARVSLDGRLTPIVDDVASTEIDRPYTGGDFSVSTGGMVAYTSGTAERPANVSIANGGSPKRLTWLSDDILGSKALAGVRKIAVKAADGREIDAWLTTPATPAPGGKYPLILEIHGGPFAAYGPHFSTDDQLYASAGYAVLSVNPRGSTSYGEEFANLIHHKYPGDDYGDLMAAVDAAIAGGTIDPNNLFVTGGSGGGVLTAWIVGKTDRFKAAATQKPVIDWASFALTADNPAFFSRYWFGSYPWEDYQSFWARSPLSLVGNVKTPTLVVVGSEDYRTPVSEAEQYYAALQLRSVPTALVKVPGASHGGIAARPSQSAAKASAILSWFERYRNK